MKNHKIIYVNPVKRVSAQGRDRQTFSFIDPRTKELRVTTGMSKTKETGVPTVLTFPYNSITGRLDTGLEETIENPFKEMEPEQIMIQYGLPKEWREHLNMIVKQPNITMQTMYEIQAAVKPDYYTSDMANGQTIFTFSKSSVIAAPNFLQTLQATLYDQPNRFTSETARGRLMIMLMKKHPFVAKSYQDVNPAIHLFYISEENAVENETAKRREVINDAIFNLVSLQRTVPEFQIFQIASVLTKNGKPIISGKMTKDSVNREIDRYINEDSPKQLSNIEQFNRFYKMLDEQEGRDRLWVTYMIQQAINSNVISLRDGFYVWHSQSEHPNVYKLQSLEKLVNFMINEYTLYNPKDKETSNWYYKLYTELDNKNVRLK